MTKSSSSSNAAGGSSRGLLTRQAGVDEQKIDHALRPQRFDDYVGQKALIDNLRVFATAARQPLVVLIEDLHWLDPASEEYLTYIVDAVAGQWSDSLGTVANLGLSDGLAGVGDTGEAPGRVAEEAADEVHDMGAEDHEVFAAAAAVFLAAAAHFEDLADLALRAREVPVDRALPVHLPASCAAGPVDQALTGRHPIRDR